MDFQQSVHYLLSLGRELAAPTQAAVAKFNLENTTVLADALGGVTGDRGQYRFLVVPAGTYELRASRASFAPAALSNLIVRFGETFGRFEIAACVLTPFPAIAFITWLPLFALPLGVVLVRCAWRSKGAELNRCLAMAGALQWAFGILFVIGSLI